MKIFISHSSKDQFIVQPFTDLLVHALRVSVDDILCTSLDGHKIEAGVNWRDSLKSGIDNSDVVFLIITKNYKESEVCLNEMGAIYFKDNIKIIPLIVPPIKNENIGILFETKQIERLNDEGSLERIKDILSEFADSDRIKADYWNKQKQRFVKTVNEYSDSLTKEMMDELQDADINFPRGNYTNYIVDAVFSHDDKVSNIDLLKYLTNDLKNKSEQSIDIKYNYLGSISAANWISLSQNPSYGHAKLIQSIKDNLEDIITAMNLNSNEKIDFISLGSGDGVIDKFIIHNLLIKNNLNTFYPFDISFDLLQKVVNEVVNSGWWSEKIKVKAIHGDFSELANYKSVYDHDSHLNLFSVLGYTFGNYNESEFLGKIRQGMNTGDYLLLDARLHSIIDLHSEKLTNEQKETLIIGYNNESTNKFAFGAIEAVTNADYKSVEFECIPKREITVVPNAINILIECKNINAKFRTDNKTFKKDRICIGATTLYSFDELAKWFQSKKFQLVWLTKTSKTGLFLLKKF